MCVCVCALVHPIRFDPQYRVRYWVFSEPLRQEGGRPQGGWGGWVRTSIQLPSPSGVRYLSLSLSLVVVVVVVERELYQTTPYSLSVCLSLCLCLSLSLSVCVSYLPCPRPSWPRPSANSNSPLLSCPPQRLPRLFCLLRSVLCGVFSVYEFTPVWKSLDLSLLSSRAPNRTDQGESRRATSQEEEVEDLVSHHPSSWSVWGGRRQGVC